MSSPANHYVLCIDLGTSAAKAALVSIDGKVLGWESEPIPLYLTPNGGAEQNPHEWWQAVLASCKRLLAKDLVHRQEIVAVCATTQGASTLPVDRQGNPLMNCLTWLDARGSSHVRKFARGILNVDGYDLLKILRWIPITGGVPSLAGKDNFGHILFIKAECPDVYDQTYKFLGVLDYINLRLTGEFATTADSIHLAWVTDIRDPSHIDYHPGLLKSSTIDPGLYPPIVNSVEVIGNLKASVASDLGLSQDVRVVAGAVDYSSAAIGSGAVTDFATHLYIGTSSWLGAHVPFKKTDLTHKIASLACAIPGKYLLLASQDIAGSNLTFLRDNLIFFKDELLHAEPTDFFPRLDEVASKVPAGSHGLVYTPWLYGERCPVDDPWLRGAFYNLSLESTRADLVRAVLEGVALNTRWMLDPVEKFMGRKADPINMVGGGARSGLWAQIHADVLNRTIQRMSDPVQCNVRGAGLLAAVGLGEIRFQDIPDMVPFAEVYEPDPGCRELYDKRFDVFLEFYKRNKEIYRRLNQPN